MLRCTGCNLGLTCLGWHVQTKGNVIHGLSSRFAFSATLILAALLHGLFSHLKGRRAYVHVWWFLPAGSGCQAQEGEPTQGCAGARAGALPAARAKTALAISLFLSLSLCLSLSLGTSVAQLVESRPWIWKALSSILASATTEWVAKKSSPQSLRRNLKPEIPQVFRTSAVPVQEWYAWLVEPQGKVLAVSPRLLGGHRAH